jgi:hypothetical protein
MMRRRAPPGEFPVARVGAFDREVLLDEMVFSELRLLTP